jgi:hypothetical protein
MGPMNKTPEEVKERIFSERAQGLSYKKIADGLNKDGIPTQNNRQWYATTVKNLVDSIKPESLDD